MPTLYGFVTSAEDLEEREQASQRRSEIRKKELARLHPLIAAVLNDFITALAVPDLYFERENDVWKIVHDDISVYSIKILQQANDLWLEYTDAALREMGAFDQYHCIAVNIEKLPAVLKLILGVDIRPVS